MSGVRCQISDSDNKAISVQVQLDLDLPTGTELGNLQLNEEAGQTDNDVFCT